MRDGIKDLQNLKGDWVQRYRTIPVVFGSSVSKLWISVAIVVASSHGFFVVAATLGTYAKLFPLCPAVFIGSYSLIMERKLTKGVSLAAQQFKTSHTDWCLQHLLDEQINKPI